MKKGQYQIFNICRTRFPISMKSHIHWTKRLYSSEIKLYIRMTIFYWNLTEYFWKRRVLKKNNEKRIKYSVIYTNWCCQLSQLFQRYFLAFYYVRKTDRARKYIVAIFHKFSTMGMRFQMQTTNVLKRTHTSFDVFHRIGHFCKSACFDIRILSCLR